MTADNQIDAEINMGHQAQEVLNNPAFQRAFEAMKEDQIQAWTSSNANDREGRENVYLMMRLTEKVKLNLESMMTTGRMAEKRKLSLIERSMNAYDAWKSGND